MVDVKKGSWLEDLIAIYNQLEGEAPYSEVYPLAEERRKKRGASWTREAKASIRRTVEDHAQSSKNFRGQAVFYSVNGHGKGVWGLMPEYLPDLRLDTDVETEARAYSQGIEGIIREVEYLKRSRDPRLVQQRKLLDNFTCQACGFRLMVGEDKFVIDVHHLNPVGKLVEATVTSIDDLVCLCPNCHRIAHSRSSMPLSIEEIRALVGK